MERTCLIDLENIAVVLFDFNLYSCHWFLYYVFYIFVLLFLESAQKFASVFASIDRLPQLYKYYHKCHKVKYECHITENSISMQEKCFCNVASGLLQFRNYISLTL